MGKPCVLVVDDDDDIRDAVADALTERGYDVETAADGAIALASMRTRPPALVLLDLMMPNIDGWRVVYEMGRDPSLTGIPVCVLSAFADAAPPGVVEVLAKPVKALPLLATVARYCGK